MRKGKGPQGLWAVAATSFAESAIVPIPIDAILVPVMLADHKRLWLAALVATVASVLGGIAGYLIGLLLYETLVQWLVELYNWQESFQEIQARFHEEGWWIVIFGAVSPLPYKLIAIASGVQQLSLPLFILASVAGRGLRFLAIAIAMHYFGPQIRILMDRHAQVIGWIVLAILILGFVGVEWFF